MFLPVISSRRDGSRSLFDEAQRRAKLGSEAIQPRAKGLARTSCIVSVCNEYRAVDNSLLRDVSTWREARCVLIDAWRRQRNAWHMANWRKSSDPGRWDRRRCAQRREFHVVDRHSFECERLGVWLGLDRWHCFGIDQYPEEAGPLATRRRDPGQRRRLVRGCLKCGDRLVTSIAWPGATGTPRGGFPASGLHLGARGALICRTAAACTATLSPAATAVCLAHRGISRVSYRQRHSHRKSEGRREIAHQGHAEQHARSSAPDRVRANSAGGHRATAQTGLNGKGGR